MTAASRLATPQMGQLFFSVHCSRGSRHIVDPITGRSSLLAASPFSLLRFIALTANYAFFCSPSFARTPVGQHTQRCCRTHFLTPRYGSRRGQLPWFVCRSISTHSPSRRLNHFRYSNSNTSHFDASNMRCGYIVYACNATSIQPCTFPSCSPCDIRKF
jgi:hypothetical protein